MPVLQPQPIQVNVLQSYVDQLIPQYYRVAIPTSGIDSNTEILLSLNNNINDSSQNAAVVTNNAMTFSNTTPIFSGTYYGVFDGVSSYLQIPNASYLNPGSGNFTIDFWFNFTTLPGGFSSVGLYAKYDGGANNGFYADYNTFTHSLVVTPFASGSIFGKIIASFTPSTSTWYHFAWVKNGSNYDLFINGNSVGTASSGTAIPSTTYPFSIGAFATGGTVNSWANIEVSEFRISDVARWTSNFTPPVTPFGRGINTVELPTFYKTGSTQVFLNGQYQSFGSYTETSGNRSVTFQNPISNTTFEARYNLYGT